MDSDFNIEKIIDKIMYNPNNKPKDKSPKEIEYRPNTLDLTDLGSMFWGSQICQINTINSNCETTYLLQSPEQLDSLIKSYHEHSEQLSESDRKYYESFIEKSQRTATTTSFDKNIDAKKAFLALKKLDKYGYDTSKIPKEDKKINENNELLGVYSNDYTEMRKMIDSDIEYKTAMDNFYQQIYDEEKIAHVCLVSDDKDSIHKLAAEMLKQDTSNYNSKAEDLYQKCSDFRSVTYICSTDNEWNNWNLEVLIDGDLEKKGCYLPEELVIMHELYHVKQSNPGKPEDYDDPYVELGATLDSLVRSDEIHKKINSIPINEEVEYPFDFTTPQGKKVNLGTLANKFREIKQNNNFDNWEQVFMSPEGMSLIKNTFN